MEGGGFSGTNTGHGNNIGARENEGHDLAASRISVCHLEKDPHFVIFTDSHILITGQCVYY